MKTLKPKFNPHHAFILLTIPAIIMTGCASTSMDTAFIKDGDKIIPISESTVKETNMAVIKIEPIETTAATEDEDLESVFDINEEITEPSIIVSSGNPNAYVELNNEDSNNPETSSEGVISSLSVEIETEHTAIPSLDEATTASPSQRILLFKTNSAKVSMEDTSALDLHAQYLLSNPEAKLLINGHADKRGSAQYNQQLSEKRARAVYDILVGLGVTESQLSINASGDSSPIVDPNNWQANRRVELRYQTNTVLSKR